MRLGLPLSCSAVCWRAWRTLACDGKSESRPHSEKHQKGRPAHTTFEERRLVASRSRSSTTSRPIACTARLIVRPGAGRRDHRHRPLGLEQHRQRLERAAAADGEDDRRAYAESPPPPPKVSAEFSCLGTVDFDGQGLGSPTRRRRRRRRTACELARTILVDPATGLPAFNIISAPGKTHRAAAQGSLHATRLTSAIEKPLLNATHAR